jgi:hypothetical protein
MLCHVSLCCRAHGNHWFLSVPISAVAILTDRGTAWRTARRPCCVHAVVLRMIQLNVMLTCQHSLTIASRCACLGVCVGAPAARCGRCVARCVNVALKVCSLHLPGLSRSVYMVLILNAASQLFFSPVTRPDWPQASCTCHGTRAMPPCTLAMHTLVTFVAVHEFQEVKH